MAATTPAGLYNVGVTSTGLTGSGFPTAGGQTSQGRGRLTEPCPAPTVTIASKPVTLVTAGAPGSYRATLTAAGNPAGGTYSWSAGNPNYSQFFLLFSGTQNSAAATLTVVSPTVLDPGVVTVTAIFPAAWGMLRSPWGGRLSHCHDCHGWFL